MSAFPRRAFGSTGLSVPALGLGGGALGDPRLSDGDAEALLAAALEMGVALIDTARSYGASEDRIGRFLPGRRDEVVLSTKVGYGIEGFADWTGPCVAAGIDAALRRFGTDRIDIVHLHSCPLEVLQQGDVVDALLVAVRAGKVLVPAYSGENEALEWAADSGRFGGLQASVNLLDQAAADGILRRARARGTGVIAKRALANAPWRFAERPAAADLAAYWDRFRALRLDPHDHGWEEIAVRFAAWHTAVDAAIVGTADVDHLRSAVAAVRKGPLPADTIARIGQAYAARGAAWRGVV